ncbi:unnamed protein product [Dracunculus medinensis]|uniref:N-acetyltransferase n=1 Tax=Dracunculus medinensis TaxID=318479 RepID=A0A0N4UNL9_DRAME|nr:unnamed protein product [Dracunculus medinensis]
MSINIEFFMNLRRNLPCLYRKIGRFDAQNYGNHLIIGTLFIFNEKNEAIKTRNCGFIDPHPIKGDIIIDCRYADMVTPTMLTKLRKNREINCL